MTGKVQDLIRVAAPQYGLISREQVLTLGMTDDDIFRRVTAGWLTPVHAGVYAVGSPQRGPEQALLAACMAAGPDAVASHRAAAWLWGFDGFSSPIREVTFSEGRGPLPEDVFRHRTRRFDPVDRTVHREIPVTTRERTLLDLGAVARPYRVEMAIEHYLRTGGTETKLADRLKAIGGRGARGVGVARAILKERAGQAALGSALEVRYAQIMRAHGYWPGIPQYEVVLPGNQRIRIDSAYPVQKVAVEIDGYMSHTGRMAHNRDRERYVLLTRRGWQHLPFTYDDIMKRPLYVVNSVLDVVGSSVLMRSNRA